MAANLPMEPVELTQFHMTMLEDVVFRTEISHVTMLAYRAARSMGELFGFNYDFGVNS